MDKVYFKKIVAKGEGKRESAVEFTPGLNIICGPSNTGKTLIFKVFKQMFGSSNAKTSKNDDEPFILDDNTGYTDFFLTISKDNKDIVLSRKIDSDTIHVASEHEDVTPGNYAADGRKPNAINEALLQIFGIEPFMLPESKDGKRTSFSMKFLDYLFFADEGKIDSGDSMLLFHSKAYSAETQSKANLLYLMLGMDFSHYLKEGNEEKQKERNAAVRSYISEQLARAKLEIREAKDLLLKIDLKGLETKPLQEELQSAREEIDKQNIALSEDENQLRKIDEGLKSDRVFASRLENLCDQYRSDFERLEFLSAGLEEESDCKEVECPYCHSLVHELVERSSEEDIARETEKTRKGLGETLQALAIVQAQCVSKEERQAALAERIKKRKDKLARLEERREELASALKDYDRLVEASHRLNYLEQNKETLEKNLLSYPKAVSKKREDFYPDRLFPTSFFDEMTERIRSIMAFCGDQRSPKAIFDSKTFDVSVDGQPKSSNNGKGFRSFLNDVTLLAFRDYLFEYGTHVLPAYVIDSPLKNLDVGELDDQNIKDNLFRYFIHASGKGQLIVIENTNNFTMSDELKDQANIIEFTHGYKKGRYGFLLDYRDEAVSQN